MIRAPKFVLASGGVVLAVGALTLAVPRAAHAVAALLVQVTNTPASPVPTVATDNPALQPFAQIQTGAPGSLNLGFVVPAGKTWAIETVSVVCLGGTSIPAGLTTDVRLFMTTGGNNVGYYFAPAQNAPQEFMVTQPLRAYADPGTFVNIGSGSGVPADYNCTGTVSGHLVNPPI
jgi:hypothetical protein